MNTDWLSAWYQGLIYMGAILGAISTYINIRRELTKRPKIKCAVIETSIRVGSTYTTKRVNNEQISSYSATCFVKLQGENSGPELTSLTEIILTLDKESFHSPKISKKGEIIGSGVSSSIEQRYSNFSYRSDDDRILILPAGGAFREIFQFDITAEHDFSDTAKGQIRLGFVNHAPLTLDLSFKSEGKNK